jgi:hypothetical protein
LDDNDFYPAIAQTSFWCPVIGYRLPGTNAGGKKPRATNTTPHQVLDHLLRPLL